MVNISSNIMVSVIVITYNHQNYIKKTLESILSQNCNFKIEVLVCDDNSPDDTNLVVEEVARNHKNGNWIVYEKHSINLGGTGNFIWASNKANGKYIAICEGDDYWNDSNKLSLQVDFLEKNPTYVLTGHDSYILEGENINQNKTKLLEKSKKSCSKYSLQKGFWVLTNTACYRNIKLEFTTEMKNNKGLDSILFSLLGNHGHYKFMPEINNAVYRIHDNGVFSSANISEKKNIRLNQKQALSNYYSTKGQHKLALYFNLNWINKKNDFLELIRKEKSVVIKIFLRLKFYKLIYKEFTFLEIIDIIFLKLKIKSY